jgi:hypothetical protein
MAITINSSVYVVPSENRIKVDGEALVFNFSKPATVKDIPIDLIEQINWNHYALRNICYYEDVLYGQEYREILLTDEDWETCIKPFIDLWQAEKDRLEQEQIEAEQELLKFENRKERALETLVNDYHSALESGFVRTSMGFDADISSDSVATLSATNLALNRNILAEEPPKTVFRDFYGLKRELDKVQVELLICQINAAQNHIRELKYTFKDKIKNTIDNESLNAALDTCAYSTLDFSNLAENGKPSVMPFEQVSTYVDRIDTRYR